MPSTNAKRKAGNWLNQFLQKGSFQRGTGLAGCAPHRFVRLSQGGRADAVCVGKRQYQLHAHLAEKGGDMREEIPDLAGADQLGECRSVDRSLPRGVDRAKHQIVNLSATFSWDPFPSPGRFFNVPFIGPERCLLSPSCEVAPNCDPTIDIYQLIDFT